MTCPDRKCRHAYCIALRQVLLGQIAVCLPGIDPDDGEPCVYVVAEVVGREIAAAARHPSMAMRALALLAAMAHHRADAEAHGILA